MDSPVQAPRQTRLIAVGLLVTAVLIAAMFPTRLADRLENVTWDVRMRGLPRPPADPRIVHIDIDDSSLRAFGRWPWPRSEIASLIDTLREAGAAAIVLDIEFPEPQAEELRPLLITVNDPQGRSRTVDNDRLLADAVAAAPTIYLAASAKLAHAHPPTEAPPQRMIDLAAGNLRTDPKAAAETLGIPFEQAVRELTAAKRIVIRDRLRRWLEPRPGDSPRELETEALAAILGEGATKLQTVENSLVTAELQYLLSIRAMAASSGLGALPAPKVRQFSPPIPSLCAAAGTVGLTAVEPDPDDFVVRAIPLMASYDGQAYPQLAFAVACDLLDVSADQIEVVPGDRITLTRRDGRRVQIPIDEHCQMLVHWSQSGSDIHDQARHVAIKDVAAIWKTAEEIERNWTRFYEIAELEFFKPPAPDERADADRHDDRLYYQWIQKLSVRRQRLRAGLDAAAMLKLRNEIDVLKRRIAEREKKHRDMVAFVAMEDPDDPQLTESERRKIRIARDLQRTGPANTENAKLIEAGRRRLRKIIQGRVCLVGSIATGAADFVPTPLTARMPGVLVHSEAINTILSERFIRTTPLWLVFALPILIGTVTSWLAAKLAPKWTLVYAVAAVGVWIGAGIGAWAAADLWLPIAMPLLAILLPWASVVGFREMTTERRARWISRKFGQYTSPALLRRLSEGEQLSLDGESRNLSVFISDLQGFTSLSEHLGPAGTVRLLNSYFAVMTERLFAHEACVSKYVGDGIFAFFNAPLDQHDHALLACRAALECQEALAKLRGTLDEDIAKRLHMRIGIGTGDVYVGNCGSELKFDYTVNGDTVNVASRLEGANKYLGTRILINDEAASHVAGEMLTRPLGRIRVVGRNRPVAAYELLCASADATNERKEFVKIFTAALADYQNRQWANAQDGFRRCLKLITNDPPSQMYLDLAKANAATPPPEDWDGSVKLEGK